MKLGSHVVSITHRKSGTLTGYTRSGRCVVKIGKDYIYPRPENVIKAGNAKVYSWYQEGVK